MSDRMTRIMTEDGSLRAVAAVTTDLVEECRRRQDTDPTATVALGRLATGAALMGSLLKGEQRLALMIEGNGPLKKLHAETDACGQVRASIKEPVSALPLRQGKFDVAAAVGRAGFLHVIKDLGLKEPYRGMVQLQSGEIAEDLAYYLTTSEQVPSTVGLGVYLDPELGVAVAGGFLIQLLPGGDESLIPLIEANLAALPATTELLRQGEGPVEILQRIFTGIPFSVKDEIPLSFRCNCSREQVAGMLRSLGEKELREMAAGSEETTVTCEFCKERYGFTPEEIAAFIP
ncbi:redox-regulated molecular chaperone, HSP33 family [Desulfuromonas soudanensis]|uniref:33 kDa chaperonin n=1 Tax=Desulfuromonas soudanensis TaxID=1603606 RepID=A0A0M5IUN6_9BACT|nr:Hsp33 family molecular chaperone HslO [Desulfuromonas soudanensis]ALC18256.1 redox-regulated molecular chaperone, HSP33 family [Desulfuromonas soudanensis]